jgi:hypothetical protein
MLLVSGDKLPRTDAPAILDEAGEHAWRAEPGSWMVPLLLLLAGIVIGLAAACDHPVVLLAALSGATLTVLCAWTWWRVSSTYRMFLLNCDRFSDKTNA